MEIKVRCDISQRRDQCIKMAKWLEENTGEPLGIIMYGYWNYYGKKWKFIEADSMYNLNNPEHHWVKIDDEKLATFFALSWNTNG